ncbi:MAG TPA: acetoacetate--CoA ligase [Mycobacteriales bacterium]|nr:acetoacetate--CoA ligase [Mycobacteriales bacterium]
MGVDEGTLLWTPSPERAAASNLARYAERVRDASGADPRDYDALWRWSVADLPAFWRSVLDAFDVRYDGSPEVVLAEERMPGARWFPDLRLSFAEHALQWTGEQEALVAVHESGATRRLTRDELRAQVGAAAAGLQRLGVRQGDRVCAVLPNGVEAAVAFLATASLGAVWSSCSPDFGARSLVDRFSQIAPTVLLGVDAYTYGGKRFRALDTLEQVRAELPSLRATVVVPSGPEAELPDGATAWSELLADSADPAPVRVPFDAPLWILYSSGTTGLPKPIVQGHGGILLEHLKSHALHADLREDDRFTWFTTTGWMMWNKLVSGLLLGATVVAYDGSPGYPDLGALWRMAERERITVFGTSAPFLTSCQNTGLVPKHVADLSRVRYLGSTGAPLSPEGFAWVYENVQHDLLLGSLSGGTDLCTAFVHSCPLLPVRAGEIQCRALGADVAVLDADGRAVEGEVGELVITRPMPSMPLFFWGDDDGSKLLDAYFAEYPGTWRHGDWARLVPHDDAPAGVVIYGRSDSTLNRGGVRIGTSEFYRVVEDDPDVADSLVVDTSALGVEGRLLLFVVLREGAQLDDEVRGRLSRALRSQLSPRHVPDEISAVDAVPRTLNGKKLEVPVKRLLAGVPLEKAVSLGAVADAAALEPFLARAQAG